MMKFPFFVVRHLHLERLQSSGRSGLVPASQADISACKAPCGEAQQDDRQLLVDVIQIGFSRYTLPQALCTYIGIYIYI